MQQVITEKIAGLIEKVTFHSEESGFCVLKVKVKGHKDFITVVGSCPNIIAGEWLNAEGGWIVDSNYGQQFKAEILQTCQPDTLDGIEKYLGSGLIKKQNIVQTDYCKELSGVISPVYKSTCSDSNECIATECQFCGGQKNYLS